MSLVSIQTRCDRCKTVGDQGSFAQVSINLSLGRSGSYNKYDSHNLDLCRNCSKEVVNLFQEFLENGPLFSTEREAALYSLSVPESIESMHGAIDRINALPRPKINDSYKYPGQK
jgi:hypothetical protein